LSSKIPSVSFANGILSTGINFCLAFVAEWHVKMLVFCHRIKNHYLQQHHLFLFTNANDVLKTKHNLISVRKLVENCFRR